MCTDALLEEYERNSFDAIALLWSLKVTVHPVNYSPYVCLQHNTSLFTLSLAFEFRFVKAVTVSEPICKEYSCLLWISLSWPLKVNFEIDATYMRPCLVFAYSKPDNLAQIFCLIIEVMCLLKNLRGLKTDKFSHARFFNHQKVGHFIEKSSFKERR